MKPKFLDLSLCLEYSDSEPEPVMIEFITHSEGAHILTKNAGISPKSFPEEMAVNLERVHLTSHSGTHVDAPFHYGPYCANQPAKSIDEMPLSWFFGEALMLDCRSEEAQEPVQVEEIEKALDSQGINIDPGNIVLIYTGADELWGKPEYFTNFRGISLPAAKKLLDKGVRVIGVDSFGFDPPFHKMIQAYKQTENQETLWPCHMLGREREYCQIERLAHLSQLPKNKKFIISCFPLKLKGCGAGPARVVAIINQELIHV